MRFQSAPAGKSAARREIHSVTLCTLRRKDIAMPIQIIKDPVATLDVDVVVNAANRNLRQGTGLSDALFKAAGAAEMRAACEKLGSCAPGHAVITPGFRLPAQYVVHAVGPIWVNGRQHEGELLAACYRESLSLAAAQKARSIAFPLLSTGPYGYPREKAFRIAMTELAAFLEKREMTVYLSVYDPRTTRPDAETWMALSHYIAHPESRAPEESVGDELPSLDEMLFEPIAPEPVAKPAPKTPFIAQVMALAREKGLSESALSRRANMTLSYLSALRNRPSELPDRDAAMALCVALSLTEEETRALLISAGYFLLPSDRRDAIISFFIGRGADIYALDAALYACGERQLFFA